MTKTPTNIFGEIPAFMETLVDTSQHKKILDNLALAVFLVDEELCVQYLNPSC